MESVGAAAADVEAVGPLVKGDRHYVEGQVVPFEEDLCHEFKGHRNISVHEIPAACLPGAASPRTRSPVSASVGAMLNSGQGGTVYLGINDGGKVCGLPLTSHQQDHVDAALGWTLARFSPPVDPARCSLAFVPVLSCFTSLAAPLTTHYVKPTGDIRLHQVASPQSCWCDREAAAELAKGKVPQKYVVEINIHPWDPHILWASGVPLEEEEEEEEEKVIPPLPPLHLTEANVCYFRQESRQLKLSLEEVRQVLAHRTHQHYTLKLAALQHHLTALQALAE